VFVNVNFIDRQTLFDKVFKNTKKNREMNEEDFENTIQILSNEGT